MIKNVFPAIRRKFAGVTIKVVVQMDNARPHTKKDVRTRLEKAARNKRGKGGVKIVLSPQPANSPDLNLNDLGFYSSFESLIGNDRPNNLAEWQNVLQKLFWKFPKEKLAKLVKTKKLIINIVIEHQRDNDFKLPHSKKNVPRNYHP